MTKAVRFVRHIRQAMFGDCSRCSHSIIYHMIGLGCIKCDCDEYR